MVACERRRVPSVLGCPHGKVERHSTELLEKRQRLQLRRDRIQAGVERKAAPELTVPVGSGARSTSSCRSATTSCKNASVSSIAEDDFPCVPTTRVKGKPAVEPLSGTVARAYTREAELSGRFHAGPRGLDHPLGWSNCHFFSCLLVVFRGRGAIDRPAVQCCGGKRVAQPRVASHAIPLHSSRDSSHRQSQLPHPSLFRGPASPAAGMSFGLGPG